MHRIVLFSFSVSLTLSLLSVCLFPFGLALSLSFFSPLSSLSSLVSLLPSPSFSLSLSLSISLSLSLSPFSLSLYLSLPLSSLSPLSISLFLVMSPSASLSLSVSLFVSSSVSFCLSLLSPLSMSLFFLVLSLSLSLIRRADPGLILEEYPMCAQPHPPCTYPWHYPTQSLGLRVCVCDVYVRVNSRLQDCHSSSFLSLLSVCLCQGWIQKGAGGNSEGGSWWWGFGERNVFIERAFCWGKGGQKSWTGGGGKPSISRAKHRTHA